MAKDRIYNITDLIVTQGEVEIAHFAKLAYSMQNLHETRIRHKLKLNSLITSQDDEDVSGAQHGSTLDRGVSGGGGAGVNRGDLSLRTGSISFKYSY